MHKKLLTQCEYGKLRGVSQQAVSQMVRTGRIPVSARGRIDPDTADLALAGKAHAGGISLSEAIRRKEAALAQLRELEFQVKSGEYVDVAYVEKCQARVNSNIKAQLLALPVMVAVILLIVVGTLRLVGPNSNTVFSSVASAVD